MAEINWLAVIAASLASFAVGALWYSPLLFLNAWMKEAGVEPGQPMQNPGRVFGLSLVFTLISALAFSILLGAHPNPWYGVGSGVVVGLCLVMTSQGINYQFAGRSLKFWLIDGGFHTARFAVIGLVLGLFS